MLREPLKRTRFVADVVLTATNLLYGNHKQGEFVDHRSMVSSGYRMH